MASQGPLYPSQAGNAGGGSGGYPSWSVPSNILVDDGNAANAVLIGGTTDYIEGWGFGFSIPLASTINGILVEVKDYYGGGKGPSTDNDARLMKVAPDFVGVNQAVGTALPASLSTYRSYGGSANLWGTTWAPANINGVNFGFAINYASSYISGVYVDAMRITVYYTAIVVTSGRRRMMV